MFGLGLANLDSSFIGVLPTSGMIVCGSTTVMSGATAKTATILQAMFRAALVALLCGATSLLPMASLAAILLLAAHRLIEAHEICTIARINPREGPLTVLTVTMDLTVSVPWASRRCTCSRCAAC